LRVEELQTKAVCNDESQTIIETVVAGETISKRKVIISRNQIIH
jgi:hypothetical protein